MAGIKHDQDKPPMDLLDYEFLEQLAEVLQMGAAKYSRHNWREGIPLSRNVAATQRHLSKFMQGIDLDDESGVSHLAHAAVDIMFLYCTLRDKPEYDDRYFRKDK
jgi:hypothetical protein